MSEFEVSIVVPVGAYHTGLVDRAVASAEAQTYPVEVVVQTDPRGHGAGWARNRGAELARGDLLVFLDADDELVPTFVAETLPVFAHTGRYVYTGCLIDWGGDKGTEHWHPPSFNQRRFLDPRFQHGVTTLLPRPYFEAVGGFDEDLPAWEDPDLYARMVRAGYCGEPVDQPLLLYHARDGHRRTIGLALRRRLRQHFEQYQEGDPMACCGKKRKKIVQAAVQPASAPAAAEAQVPANWVPAEYIKRGKTEPRGIRTKIKYPRGGSGDPPVYIHPADADAEPNRPGGPLLRPLPLPDRKVAAKAEALRDLVERHLEEDSGDAA